MTGIGARHRRWARVWTTGSRSSWATSSASTPRRRRHTLGAFERHLLAHLEYEERNVAATARRLPDLQFSNQVADSDLPAEEDQQ